MNKEQTIELAKQAGWTELGADLWGATHDGAMSTYALQRFAALVRADTALEAEPTPVQECGYDETTGSCTRNPCCAVAPVQEHLLTAPKDNVTLSRELLREARDNCRASIVEDGISALRKEYRTDLEARLTAALDVPAPVQGHVATVAEVHMSRYTIEWTNGPLPEGTELFAAPQAPVPEHTWVDTAWRTTVAQAVYNQVRREINNFIGPWSAFDVDEQQRIVDAIKAVMPAPPVQEPEISDAQASLLASALGECILASGIVGKDKDGFSGPELLMFAEDLKQMLERSRQPAQEPVAVNQIRLGYGRWSDISDVELKIFVAKDGWELRTLYAAPQPRKAVKLTLEDIKRVQDSDLAFETNSCAAFAEAIQGAFIAKNGLES